MIIYRDQKNFDTKIYFFLRFEPLRLNINELTGLVSKICIKIHSAIGPGCFEKVYEEILYYELTKLGLYVERQLLLPIEYETMKIKNTYKVDLPVENSLVVETPNTQHPTLKIKAVFSFISFPLSTS